MHQQQLPDFQVDPAVRKATIRKISWVGRTSGLIFGTLSGIMAIVIPLIALQYAIAKHDPLYGWLASSLTVGCTLGALSFGPLAQWTGRRLTVILVGLFCILGDVLLAGASPNFWLFVVFHALSGVAVGGSTVAGPQYIAEMAPPSLKERLQIDYSLGLATGFLVSSVLGTFGVYLLGIPWQVMFILEALTGVPVVVAIWRMSETPRSLVRKGYSLQDIRTNFAAAARHLSDDELRQVTTTAQVSPMTVLGFTCAVVVVGPVVAMAQQSTNINGELYYLLGDLQGVGYSLFTAGLVFCGLGVINVAMTWVATPLADKFGFKRLLQGGGVLVALGLFLSGYGYLSGNGLFVVLGIVLVLSAFPWSWGAGTWGSLGIILGACAPAWMSLSSAANWVANAYITTSYPEWTSSGPGVENIVMGVITLVMSLVFVSIMVVDTRLPDANIRNYYNNFFARRRQPATPPPVAPAQPVNITAADINAIVQELLQALRADTSIADRMQQLEQAVEAIQQDLSSRQVITLDDVKTAIEQAVGQIQQDLSSRKAITLEEVQAAIGDYTKQLMEEIIGPASPVTRAATRLQKEGDIQAPVVAVGPREGGTEAKKKGLPSRIYGEDNQLQITTFSPEGFDVFGNAQSFTAYHLTARQGAVTANVTLTSSEGENNVSCRQEKGTTLWLTNGVHHIVVQVVGMTPRVQVTSTMVPHYQINLDIALWEDDEVFLLIAQYSDTDQAAEAYEAAQLTYGQCAEAFVIAGNMTRSI